MQGVPWTKFQDFYLRLGFLKILVAALSPARRSVTNEAVYQKLEYPAFRPLQGFPDLYQRSVQFLEKQSKRQAAGRPYALEGLLVINNCPSWLFAVTSDTVYKILDWGHDVEFVGRGNQISERGMILRSLLDPGAERFLAGELTAWDPFTLTSKEKLFFLYHLLEIDRVTLRMIEYLAAREPGEVLESSDVAKLTCRALFSVLDEVRNKLSPSQAPTFRVAYELARVIAQELDMRELLPASADPLSGIRKLPKPPKILKRPTGSLQSVSGRRRPSKNADHQTIPRCEQLVDLGFLRKPSGMGGTTGAQRRWQSSPTEECRKWVEASRSARGTTTFLWESFAKAAVAAFHSKPPQRESPENVARLFANAYDEVRRVDWTYAFR